jgi:voltage-gated potassium channel
MENPAGDAVDARILPRHVIGESARVLWHLRSVLLVLFLLFLLQSVAMYYLGGPVDTVTHAPATPARVGYFCAITALTIGYGDVIPTTDTGRILAVSLGMLGVLITGLITAAAVYGVQVAAHRAGIRPR